MPWLIPTPLTSAGPPAAIHWDEHVLAYGRGSYHTHTPVPGPHNRPPNWSLTSTPFANTPTGCGVQHHVRSACFQVSTSEGPYGTLFRTRSGAARQDRPGGRTDTGHRYYCGVLRSSSRCSNSLRSTVQGKANDYRPATLRFVSGGNVRVHKSKQT